MQAYRKQYLHAHDCACTDPALLQTMEEERKKLLSFVICGGGPTGVEVAAEIHDMIFDDLKVVAEQIVVLGPAWLYKLHGLSQGTMCQYYSSRLYCQGLVGVTHSCSGEPEQDAHFTAPLIRLLLSDMPMVFVKNVDPLLLLVAGALPSADEGCEDPCH